MKMTLGEKDKIAVEIRVKQKTPLLGYAKLWFGGHFLGSICEEIYLDGYLYGGLLQLSKVGQIDYPNFPLEGNAQFSFLTERANDLADTCSSNYLVSFGTMTDAFEIWAYRKDEFITILWKLGHENRFLHDDLVAYSDDIFSYTMSYESLLEFVQRLGRILKDW